MDRALSSAPARRTATMSCICAYCDFEILSAREGKDTHVRARAPFRFLFLVKVPSFLEKRSLLGLFFW